MKIAVIGSGISGLSAAYLLDGQHDITVYEKNSYLGGHSRTINIDLLGGPFAVDTGFIVFNYRNYPHLAGLFQKLDVPVMPSDMSFAASIDGGWLEYGTQTVASLFCQPANSLRPAYWKMIANILRFNRHAVRYVERHPDATLGRCLDDLGLGEWFRDYYLLAIGGAIWSTSIKDMLEFPAITFVRFFENHGLLSINDQPQWYTVKGGSREYVRRLTAEFASKIRLSAPVKRVERRDDAVLVHEQNGTMERYDQVIFACHSDQALAMLQQPTAQEQTLLGSCRYQTNHIIVHSDSSYMPKRRGAWASWVYQCNGRRDSSPSISLTYWMNRLQSIPTEQPVLVTLNANTEPEPSLIHDRYVFEHPVFDLGAINAQKQIGMIQGTDRIWYCGAWQRYGFHEDGILSAVNVAAKLGVSPSWT
jgi:predicted NAD/FAD-binding protein